MTGARSIPATDPRLAARARTWRHAALARVCDVWDPWPQGTVVRVTRCPDYYDYNLVHVERSEPVDAGELAAFAEHALGSLNHRRIDIDDTAVADAVEPELVEAGWRPTRLEWMHLGAGVATGDDEGVEEVAYEAVEDLRRAWCAEDGFGTDHLPQTAAVARLRGARILAAVRDGAPVGYAQLERQGLGAEIAEVYVAAAHRGAGVGTGLVRAAARAAADARDVWICAEQGGGSRRLYERLGFRTVWTTVHFLRIP